MENFIIRYPKSGRLPTVELDRLHKIFPIMGIIFFGETSSALISC